MKKLLSALLVAMGLCVSGANAFFKDSDRFYADCNTINQHFYTCKWDKVTGPIINKFTNIEIEIMGKEYTGNYLVMQMLDLLHHKNFKDYLTQDSIEMLNGLFNRYDSESKSNLKNQPEEIYKLRLIDFNNKLKEAGIGR